MEALLILVFFLFLLAGSYVIHKTAEWPSVEGRLLDFKIVDGSAAGTGIEASKTGVLNFNVHYTYRIGEFEYDGFRIAGGAPLRYLSSQDIRYLVEKAEKVQAGLNPDVQVYVHPRNPEHSSLVMIPKIHRHFGWRQAGMAMILVVLAVALAMGLKFIEQNPIPLGTF